MRNDIPTSLSLSVFPLFFFVVVTSYELCPRFVFNQDVHAFIGEYRIIWWQIILVPNNCFRRFLFGLYEQFFVSLTFAKFWIILRDIAKALTSSDQKSVLLTKINDFVFLCSCLYCRLSQNNLLSTQRVKCPCFPFFFRYQNIPRANFRRLLDNFLLLRMTDFFITHYKHLLLNQYRKPFVTFL